MQNDTPDYPNWFDSQRHNFENNLFHLAGKPNLKFLQIGVFTGDASMWLCENILTDETSWLYDVDTWAGSDEVEHEPLNFDKVFEYYNERISTLKSTVRLRMTSDDFFAGKSPVKFDFIYIDGDHTSHQVAKDADNSWRLLKSGGILAFDDYLWGNDLPPELTPKPAIDRFLAKYTDEYYLVAQNYQVWIVKK